MSTIFVVRFGAGRSIRYLAHARSEGLPENGWRPFVWTKDISLAEKFNCEQSARSYAAAALRHEKFQVVIAPPHGRPTDDLGGSPVAMLMAA